MAKRTLSIIAAAALSLGLSFGSAHATPATDAAEDRCEIGERADGYLGVVDGKTIDAGLRREMNEVNQARSAAYEKLAMKSGVSKQVAAQATAEKLINGARSGQCVQDASGNWVTVP